MASTRCSTQGGAQHPRAARVDPHRPPDYGSVHPSCRGISPSLQIKAIAFLANTDGSLFSVNIYPHLHKKLLLQPRGRSRRPSNKRITSWPPYQQRTCFRCSWLQLGGEATARGSPAPAGQHLLHGIFWQGGGISCVCRRGKAFGPKSPAHTASGSGDGGDGTRAGGSKSPPPSTGAFPAVCKTHLQLVSPQ